MARKKKKGWLSSGPSGFFKLPELDLEPETKRNIWAVVILVLGFISLLGLFDMAGIVGSQLERLQIFIFGWGKWLFPAALFFWGWNLHRQEGPGIKGATYLGLFLSVITLLSVLHFFVPQLEWQQAIDLGEGGGYLGYFLADTFAKLFGFWASLILFVGLFLISLMLLFNKTLSAMFGRDSLVGKMLFPVYWLAGKLSGRKDEDDEEGEEGEEEEEENEEEEEEESEEEEEGEEEEEENEEEEEEESEEEEEGEEEPQQFTKAAVPAFMEGAKQSEKPTKTWEQTEIEIDMPYDLLSNKVGKPAAGDIKSNAATIQRTLEHFNISVEMGDVTVGPTVSQYTFRPGEGVKLSRITALSNDLALALAAQSIRIEAPIPGRSLVGIEVPNQTKAVVGIREILESESFEQRKNNTMVVLGKDVNGKGWVYDLTKMPHLLVAGQTNSGKSVCLNSIIIGLLYQNNPDDLRFIMVDPKRVELPNYDGIPHLVVPVITDVSKTVNALKWCINEMERRLDLLQKYHKVNVKDYNEWQAKQKKGKDLEKLPYIVFIIDELADLMQVAAKDVEAGIIRLTQMARATGIHLILATQRPSVDVVTGLIKANLPARVAFAVASAIDSKTILDSSGAEKLLGKGDMLFTNAEEAKPRRLQGAFISTQEIRRVVEHIKANSDGPTYIDNVTERQKVKGMASFGSGSGSDDDDELLEEAKELVINAGKASTSLLQRRLSIGYGRAAKILDMLEEAGIVGPTVGNKPREIMISKEQYAAFIDQGTAGVSLHRRDEAEAPEHYLPEEEDDEENDEESEEEEEENEEDKEESEENEDENENENENEEEDAVEETEDEPEEEDEEEVEEDKKPKKSRETSSKTNDKPKRPMSPDDFDKLFSR
ncbi:DNA translocase FtsK [Candidatus Falkowbacteria bacterium]|nr:DNA translocase FtsK [Candidatus Falkowbacteria bacterium]